MAKKRVHEIAKELNKESKEIIQKLGAMGVTVKSHMSTLEDSEIESLLKLYKKEVPKTEKRSPAAPTEKNKRTGRQAGDQKKGKPAEANYYRGPGLVDRVPSRPPDRRFAERPDSIGKTQLKKVTGPAKDSSGMKNRQEKPRENQGLPKPQSPPRNTKNVDKPISQGAVRQEQSQQTKQQQNRPGQNNIAANQRHDYNKPNHAPAAGQQRWNNRNPRPSNQPPKEGRPKPAERPTQAVGAAPGVRPKTETSPGTRPQGRLDNKASNEKPKTYDKSKPQTKKPANRDRYDKRTNTPNSPGNKPYSRNAGGSRRKSAMRAKESHQIAPVQPLEKKPVVLGESITVQELALKVHKSPAELIKKLMQLGVMATINQDIDSDTASLLAAEFGYEVEIKLPVDLEALLLEESETSADVLKLRPCIVTVMGHVDHGKTSLLDAIRQTNVTATEAGGITQHIGAYQVEHSGKKITFVDTPGHEAFTAMRARGAQVTDIAILVVAAEDGVMPQTIEAINHAQEAEVPIIVAINKMDKPGANPDRVKQELTEQGLIAEEWGGDTICVNVSAVKREGLTDLLEMILLVSEMRELKANPDRPARGTVIEAELDKGRGPVATILVQNGTLKVGDNIIAGSAIGRVRAMIDDKGRRVKKAEPSTPVEVLGFSETPMAGDVFNAVVDEKMARNIVSHRQIKKREEDLKTNTRISLDDLFKRIQEGQIKELDIIVKADVQGSVEVLRQALERLNTGEVKVNIIHSGVGAISETDIMLASASNAIIIGFNVRPDINARKAAENEKVDVRLYRVIYEAIENVKAAMSGLLEPEYKEVALGRAEIRKIFKASKIGTIAGCYVLEGKIERDANVRLVRDGIVLHEGKLDSLKRFKDDAKEVLQGYECGLAFEKYNEMQEGDIVEAFIIEAVKRELA